MFQKHSRFTITFTYKLARLKSSKFKTYLRGAAAGRQDTGGRVGSVPARRYAGHRPPPAVVQRLKDRPAERRRPHDVVVVERGRRRVVLLRF